MPNISISEDDYFLLADSANAALKNGDITSAEALDKLARKASSALSRQDSKGLAGPSSKGRLATGRLRSWRDEPTTLINAPNAK